MPVRVPVLRRGAPYASLDVEPIHEARRGGRESGEPIALVSQANAGLIRRDLARMGEARAALAKIPAARLVAICEQAAERFLSGARSELAIDGGDDDVGGALDPDEYVRLLSASTGLPHALCRRNMRKIHDALARTGEVVAGLTRRLDLAILDEGYGEERGVPLAFVAETGALGVILPSNSPGVNTLWLPAIALKTPVVLKPGRADPFTPLRIARALVASGCPREAISIYPTDHAGADAVLEGCGRTLLFGDERTVARHANDPRVEVHGPGWSKVVIGADVVDEWPRFVDVIARSIADNGGRSCVNASCVVTPRHGDAIAGALAERLAAIEPRDADDPDAQLAAFTDGAVAARIDAAIEAGLQTAGAEDVSRRARIARGASASRLIERDGLAYLLPTVVRCRSFDHPLANRELLFPYASVVELALAPDDLVARLGRSLVVTVLSSDAELVRAFERAPLVDRLNVGPVPTSDVRWDQPHEGNLFELLYRRRAIRREPLTVERAR